MPNVILTTVDFSNMSLADQIEIAQRHDVLIGVQGTNIFNAAFMSSGHSAALVVLTCGCELNNNWRTLLQTYAGVGLVQFIARDPDQPEATCDFGRGVRLTAAAAEEKKQEKKERLEKRRGGIGAKTMKTTVAAPTESSCSLQRSAYLPPACVPGIINRLRRLARVGDGGDGGDGGEAAGDDPEEGPYLVASDLECGGLKMLRRSSLSTLTSAFSSKSTSMGRERRHFPGKAAASAAAAKGQRVKRRAAAASAVGPEHPNIEEALQMIARRKREARRQQGGKKRRKE